MTTNKKWKELREELREEFEELFPKDECAKLGLHPSRSHRSEALVLWSQWEIILKVALSQQREQTLKILTDEIATAHTGKSSRLTSAYMRIKDLKEKFKK